MSNNKILVVLDVDGVHLDGRRINKHDKTPLSPRRCWIGSKKEWQKLYYQADEIAQKWECDLVFAIVTAKSGVDDLLLEQVRAFYPLLTKHNQANFVKTCNSSYYCAIRNWLSDDDSQTLTSNIKFYEFSGQASKEVYVTDYKGLPNIESVTPVPYSSTAYQNKNNKVTKSDAIKRIAQAHEIPLEQCVLIDDSPVVIKEVQAEGIQVVDVSCFNDLFRPDIRGTLPKATINNHLGEVFSRFKDKINQMASDNYYFDVTKSASLASTLGRSSLSSASSSHSEETCNTVDNGCSFWEKRRQLSSLGKRSRQDELDKQELMPGF